jgi:hypothetical protein
MACFGRRFGEVLVLTLEAVFCFVFGCLALLASFIMSEGHLGRNVRNAWWSRRSSKGSGYDTFRRGKASEV